MALILYRPLFWGLLIILAGILAWLALRLRLRWLPALPLRVLQMALTLIVIFSPQGELFRKSLPERKVLVLDLSDSIPRETREQAQAWAQTWQRSEINRLIVVFGTEAKVISSSQVTWPSVDGRSSDLPTALSLANSVLGDMPGEVILATDGLSEEAEVGTILTSMTSKGHRINTLALPTRIDKNDLYVGDLWTPTTLWEQTPFTTILPVFSPVPGEVTLRLYIDGGLESERVESISQGENFFIFTIQAESPEIMTLEASATIQGDPRPENNRAFSILRVFDSPSALFITSSEPPQRFLQAITSSGIKVEIQRPESLPADLASLGKYQVIFLHNLLAQDLSFEQMLAMKIFVSYHGGGLVFLGGKNSYTLGGYNNTLLETFLPVELEPPPRSQRPPVTFILIMDRSLSMSLPKENRPIDLAREAAMRAVEILTSDDYVGVMTYSDLPIWDVPIARAGDGLTLREAMDAISLIYASGGTHMYAALQQAIQDVSQFQGHGSIHVLLLSDGRSFDGTYSDFVDLAEDAKALGISISTIALGKEADQELLKTIAEKAGGRYHFVLNPDDLPRVMIAESSAAHSENVQLGETRLEVGEPNHPVLSGLAISEIPPIIGYNALSSKRESGAEDILISSTFGDPVLSARQYGLGRVIAWMGDIGEEWATSWIEWEKLGLFWSQIVRYALPNPVQDPAQVEIRIENDVLSINAQIQDNVGLPLNHLKPVFSYKDAQGGVRSYSLSQTAPGKYSVDIPLPPEGAYRAIIAYRHEGEIRQVPAFFAVNYPLEWRPRDAKTGRDNLEKWAKENGGDLLSFELLETQSGIADGGGIYQNQIGMRVLLIVVFLWPIEIAIRRRWLPWNS